MSSRSESPSLQVRGVPRQVLEDLDRAARARGTTKNALAIAAIRDYAEGRLTPTAEPPPFEPARKPAAPYGADTAPLAISGISAAAFDAFRVRAKQDGWFSKNALIVELLRECTSAA